LIASAWPSRPSARGRLSHRRHDCTRWRLRRTVTTVTTRRFPPEPFSPAWSWPCRRANILDAVGKAGAAFKSLGDASADTTTPHGRLMLTALGGQAEFERELILARTGAGRARAKAQGVRFGRPPPLTPYQRREAMERLGQGAARHSKTRVSKK